MLRKIGFTLLFSAASISTVAYSFPTHVLQPGLTVEYEFAPNQPQVFVNYLFWSVDATCKMTTIDESDDLVAEAISKKGKVNDVALSEGQSMRVTIHSGQNLKITADSGAKVKITNLGQHTIKALCSV